MRSDERRTIARLLALLLLLAALAACGGDPPVATGAVWDQGIWNTSTWQP